MIRRKRAGSKRKIKKYIARATAITMTGLLLPFWEVCAEEIMPDSQSQSVEKETAEGNDSAIEDLSQLIAEQWEEDYFAEMIVETGSGQIEVDGETASLKEEFDLTVGEARQVVASESSIEEYFENEADSCYETERIGSGKVQVTAPFQTRRLIVTGLRLSNTYNASKIINLSEYDTTILQYDTEEQAKDAYDKITAIYGEKSCQPDRVYSSEQLLQETTETGTYQCTSWGAEMMGMDDLKNQTRCELKGKGPYTFTNTATVAIIDTGINKNSKFFSRRTITENSRAFPVAIIDGEEKADESQDISNISDTLGHGTHVAGIIADSTPDNIQLMILKVFDDDGDGPYSAILAAMIYAIENGADVMNMSLGFYEKAGINMSEYASMNEVIDCAYEKGIPICVASGNENADISSSYPACNEKVLAVGSINEQKVRAGSSNFGDELDFCAPGVRIFSASNTLNFDSISKSGTSMASPHLASAVAYVKLLFPYATVSQVESILKSYCVDLGDEGWDEKYGWGCPDLTSLYQDVSWESYDASGVTFDNQTFTYDGTNHMLVAGGQIPSDIKIYYSADGYTSPGTYTITAYLEGSAFRYRTIGTRTAVLTILSTGNQVTQSTETTVIEKVAKVRSFKVKRKSSGTVKLQWSKNPEASGYQIQYSLKKNFKTKKTIRINKPGKASYVIKKLKKGRNYYFRIRAYKAVDGKTTYSAWSAKKKI